MAILLQTALIACVVSACAEYANGTEQGYDTVIVNGESHGVVGRLMNVYWTDNGPRPKFAPTSTANIKGYTAQWELRGEKLYLTKFQATVGRKPYDITAELNASLPVLADWVSGPVHFINNLDHEPIGWHSNNAKRYTFKHGKVVAGPELIDRIYCRTESYGLVLHTVNGKLTIKSIHSGSIASQSKAVSEGEVLHSVINYDGTATPLTHVSPAHALGYMRRLRGQPLTLRIVSGSTISEPLTLLKSAKSGR